MLIEQGVPLRLVGAQISNMKPDDSVVEAQVAQKAAEARTAAIKTLTDNGTLAKLNTTWLVPAFKGDPAKVPFIAVP